MASWKSLLAAAATAMTLFASSSADPSLNAAHIYPMPAVPATQKSSALVLSISATPAFRGPNQFMVVPLTLQTGANQSALNGVSIQGNLVQATLTGYANISGQTTIALLSCDATDTTFVDPDHMLSTLIGNDVAAILLYSETGAYCNLLNSNSNYFTIFSMMSQNDTARALNITNAHANVMASINSSDISGGSGDPGTGGNSTVAMSILYSITGLITVLFLIIIGTGAMRAHRYPERYGPRGASGGRPRQSRAKGIARAMLETLPIVKFGDATTAKPDPGLELESGTNNHQSPAGASSSDADVPTLVPGHLLSTTLSNAETQPKAGGDDDRAAGAAGTGAAAGTTSGPDAEDDADHLGCSICTEDFTVGEDVRVLPCNHKFHPNCVDPWLVNVSGTCPLCRLDLRPSPTGGSDLAAPEGDANAPPPLGAEDGDTTAAAAGSSSAAVAGSSTANSVAPPPRRGHGRFLDLNLLRHATAEERLEALRHYRTAHNHHHTPNRQAAAVDTVTASSAATTADAAGAAGAAAEPATAEGEDGEDDHDGRAARLTRRLRDTFRVRTRTQVSQPPQPPPGSS